MALTDLLQNPNSFAVSTSIRVTLLDGTTIGVIKSIDPSQNRDATPIRGIGTGDTIIDHVWQLSTYTLAVTKLALFNKFLFGALGYGTGIRMIAELKHPIGIQEVVQFPDGQNAQVTNYNKCYLTSYTAPRTIDGDITITESANFNVTSITNNETDPRNGIEFGL